MIDFIQNKHNLNEMGLESKKKFMSNFTDYISVQKYIDLYQRK